jgi:SAM-dependent methyltransferase
VDYYADTDYIRRRIGSLPPRALVLDAGCGPCRLSQSLAEEGFGVVGMDLTESLWKTKGNYELVRSSILTPPFRDGSFDAVVSVGVVHHTGDTEKAVGNCVRMSRGKVVIFLYLERMVIAVHARILKALRRISFFRAFQFLPSPLIFYFAAVSTGLMRSFGWLGLRKGDFTATQILITIFENLTVRYIDYVSDERATKMFDGWRYLGDGWFVK